MEKVRIAKFVASVSKYSRRKVEEMIFDGRILLNGVRLENPGEKVSIEDRIVIDGDLLKVSKKAVAGSNKKLFAFYKPNGCICSARDERGRKTVYDILKESPAGRKVLNENPNLLYVGRLDFKTDGLLLMTNSGDLKNRVEHPSAILERVYRVKVSLARKIVDADFEPLRKKMSFETEGGKRVHYAPFEVKLLDVAGEDVVKYSRGKKIVKANSFNKGDGKGSWCEVKIFEGKNREIRNAFERFGFKVSKLQRVSYGPYSLDALELSRGQIKEVPFAGKTFAK